MKKTILTFVAIIMAFGLYSCDKENVGGVDLGTIDTPSDYFVLVDDDSSVPDLYDATMESDFCMLPTEYEGAMMMHKYQGNKHGKKPPRGQRFFQFGEIFRSINLTDEQIALIPDIIKDHYLCTFEAKMTLRTELEEIFASARTARAEIITSFRNGEITREEARLQLDTLNASTRETIQNSDTHKAFEEVMCECFNTMLTSIEEILDDTQLELWKTWLETSEHPCLD